MNNVRREVTPEFHSDIYVAPLIPSEALHAVAAALNTFIDDLCAQSLKGYIWNREPLVVRVAEENESDETKPLRLIASMRHGGSVEDEWLAVHLLLLATSSPLFAAGNILNEPTAKDDRHNLVASVRDEDGELLLVEAADVLPAWIQPSNAAGRVWLSEGAVHLISLDVHPGDGETSEETDQAALVEGRPLHHATALSLLRSEHHSTLAPTALMAALIGQRMTTYPDLEWAIDSQHTTLLYLPMIAAKIISRYPQLIADAAESFEGRDGPDDARRLREMSVFLPSLPSSGRSSSPTAFLVNVKLPKRLYAMMLGERYFPPKAFGAPWRESVMQFWDSRERDDPNQVDKHGRRRDLGCKITCGLELALANVNKEARSNPHGIFDHSEQSIRTSSAYTSFVKSLTRMNYFGQEIRDSYEWKQKEQKAFDLWRNQTVDQSARKSKTPRVSDRLAFLSSAIQACSRDRSLPPHIDEALQKEEQLALLEDPDGFLYESLDGRDDSSKSSLAQDEHDSMSEKIATQQINAFSKKLQSFVQGEGDEIGALFDDEDAEEEMSDEDHTDDKRRPFSELSEIEKGRAYEKLIPALDMKDWGAKNDCNVRESADEIEEITTDGVRKSGGASDSALKGFSRTIKYDGASDSDESVDDDVLRAGDTYEDRINRAKALEMEHDLREDEQRRAVDAEENDGVDDDAWDDEEDERAHPAGFRLGQSDLKDFLDFTRKELGLTEEQYNDILADRREKGAYVPDFAATTQSFATKRDGKQRASGPRGEEGPGTTFRQQTRENRQKFLSNSRTTEAEKNAARLRAEEMMRMVEEQATLDPSPAPPTNAFERLMNTMDDKLRKASGGQNDAKPVRIETDTGDAMRDQQGVILDDEMAIDDYDDDEQTLSEQDAELLEKMMESELPASLQVLLHKRDTDPLGLSPIERRVMDGMLQSYQEQHGNAGPISGMLARFGLKTLPRHS